MRVVATAQVLSDSRPSVSRRIRRRLYQALEALKTLLGCALHMRRI
eukprot:SAG31_NODE_32596_length_353_cov_2.027559_1_plen_45_part_10